jgi:hypothetical protein
MTNDQFHREEMYQVTMSLMRSLLNKGSLTKDQYEKIDTVMLEKYRPTLGRLFSDPDLLCVGQRVMNGTGKE